MSSEGHKLQAEIDSVVRAAADAPSGIDIVREVLSVLETLIEKNAQYGDSALEPIGIMHGGSALDAIDVRIDDKLSRLKRGVDDDPEDVLLDLVGYIILRRIAQRREG
jgi:hypothetical protein